MYFDMCENAIMTLCFQGIVWIMVLAWDIKSIVKSFQGNSPLQQIWISGTEVYPESWGMWIAVLFSFVLENLLCILKKV